MARTFYRFLIVGCSGVLVNSATLFMLYQVLRLPLILSSALSVEVAIASNFIGNDLWTFRRTGRSLSRFVKFNLVSLGGLVVTTGTAWLLVQHGGMHYLLANLTGIGLAAMCNFVANLKWTWRR